MPPSAAVGGFCPMGLGARGTSGTSAFAVVDEKASLLAADLAEQELVKVRAAQAKEITLESARNGFVNPDPERFIQHSPYTDHMLDLNTLDAQTQLVARALIVFDKTRSDFATAPYADSFNLADVFAELVRLTPAAQRASWTSMSLFVVAFRSQIPPSTNYGDLSALDRDAHREATGYGGLLRYWFNEPDKNGRNLATCLWTSTKEAHRAGHGPRHRKAASSVRDLYTEWKIERFRLTLDDGLKGWSIAPWQDEKKTAGGCPF